ncbi:MAG TPA: ABC transporter substrate-binding protein, partial [Bradyrhizobium sp.]|nr:ABC transporter substrate-binding protein [Bradyrhizobium sp.]
MTLISAAMPGDPPWRSSAVRPTASSYFIVPPETHATDFSAARQLAAALSGFCCDRYSARTEEIIMEKSSIAGAHRDTQRDAGRSPAKAPSRRDILIRTAGGALAASAFGAVPLRSHAAEPVNIGALYPVTGSLAQIGQGCVNAAKLAVQMVNDAGGIKSLGGARLNLIVSDIQSDTTVTRTETDRLINGSKVSAIHGCY